MHCSRIIYLSIIIFTSKFSIAQQWAPLGLGPNLQVNALFADSIEHLIYVGGGGWINNGGPNYHSIAKWDGTSWDSLFHGISQNNPVKAITRFQNEIYVGVSSSFPIIGINSPFLVKYDGVNWSAVSNGMGGPPYSFYLDADTLLMAGGFDSVDHNECHMVTSWNGISFSSMNCFYENVATKILKYNNEFYIAGQIFNIDSTGLHGVFVSKYNGTDWSVVGQGVNNFFAVNSAEVYNGKLYIGGAFNKPDCVENNIVAWNGTNWETVGGGLDGYVYCFIVFNNKLYAAGAFDHAGGVPAKNIACWDGTKWCGFVSDFNHPIYSMAVLDSELYVGGSFTTIDGDSIAYVAKWIGVNFTDTCGVLNAVNELTTELNKTSLYPNPTTSTVTLQLPSTNKQKQITILDLNGREIYETTVTQEKLTIDLSNYARGFYFVSVRTDEGVYNGKVVKE